MNKSLGLKRDDLITIDNVKTVDKLLKFHKIYVFGDAKYTSSNESNLIIKLRLKDSHFTHVGDENRITHINTHRVNKNATIYSFDKIYDTKEVRLYDGKTIIVVSFKEFNTMQRDKKNYIFIKKSKLSTTLEDAYTDRLKERTELIEATKGKIDLFRYSSLNDCILDTFKNYSKSLQEPEQITAQEALFINNAFQGGLMYAEKYDGMIHGYDVNSMYPSIYIHDHFQFPVKEGKLIEINQADFEKLEHYKYGIYHCNVEFDENRIKLFRFNKRNYYTHTDLTRARELNFKITIIEDDGVNALQYERSDLIRSEKVFSAYVNMLFPLKQKYNYKIIKTFLNMIWGLFSEKNTRETVIKTDSQLNQNNDEEILHICQSGEPEGKNHRVTFVNRQKIFKNNLARMSPFLTAFARLKLSRVMEPFESQIKRIHTDAFYLEKELNNDDLDIGIKLGQFKLDTKKTGMCKIENVRKMTILNE